MVGTDFIAIADDHKLYVYETVNYKECPSFPCNCHYTWLFIKIICYFF